MRRTTAARQTRTVNEKGQEVLRTRRFIGNEFEWRLFDLLVFVIPGIHDDLAAIPHGRFYVFSDGISREPFDHLCERDLEEIRLTSRFFGPVGQSRLKRGRPREKVIP